MPPTPLYDPPLPSAPSARPSSRSSRSSRPRQPPEPIFTRLEDGLSTAEHLAIEGEYVAQQVEKAARVGGRIVEDVEECYGGEGRARSTDRESGTSTTTTEEEEEEVQRKTATSKSRPTKQQVPPPVVPYQRLPPPSPTPPSTVKQRKKTPQARVKMQDELGDFEDEVDHVQEFVDDLSDVVELIALLRHRLTSGTYPVIAKLLRTRSKDLPSPLPRSPKVTLDEARKLAALVTQVKVDLLTEYRNVSALQPRNEAVVRRLSHEASNLPGVLKTYSKVQKRMSALNSSFAALLDFVEDRAEEEKQEIDAGEADLKLMARMQEDRPEWARAKRMTELKRAKEVARKTSLAKVDLTSYAGWYLIDNPFSELDSVLAAIDAAESGISSKKDEKKGSWALGWMVSQAVKHPSSSSSPSPSSLRTPKSSRSSPASKGYFDIGKPSHRRYSTYRSEDKPSQSRNSTDGEGSDVEKSLLGEKDGGLDVGQLPEHVPTDDTSGYVESKEDLLEDERHDERNLRIFTPIVLVWWASIFILYIYYAIARLTGHVNPLGNLELAEHFGDLAWNDTSSGLSTSSICTTSYLLSTTTTSLPVDSADPDLSTTSSSPTVSTSSPTSSPSSSISSTTTSTSSLYFISSTSSSASSPTSTSSSFLYSTSVPTTTTATATSASTISSSTTSAIWEETVGAAGGAWRK